MRISLSEEQTRWKFQGATMLLVDTRLERNNSMYEFFLVSSIWSCKFPTRQEKPDFFSFLFFIYHKTWIFKFSSTLNACRMSLPHFLFSDVAISHSFFFSFFLLAHHKIDTEEHTMRINRTEMKQLFLFFVRIEWSGTLEKSEKLFLVFFPS